MAIFTKRPLLVLAFLGIVTSLFSQAHGKGAMGKGIGRVGKMRWNPWWVRDDKVNYDRRRNGGLFIDHYEPARINIIPSQNYNYDEGLIEYHFAVDVKIDV